MVRDSAATGTHQYFDWNRDTVYLFQPARVIPQSHSMDATTAELIRAQTATLEKLLTIVNRKDDAVMEMVHSFCTFIAPAAKAAQQPCTVPQPAPPPVPPHAPSPSAAPPPVDAVPDAAPTPTKLPRGSTKTGPPRKSVSPPTTRHKRAGHDRSSECDSDAPPPRKRGRPSHAVEQQSYQKYRYQPMAARMAMVKAAWGALTPHDRELLAYLLCAGLDTGRGWVWSYALEVTDGSNMEKFMALDLARAARWTEDRPKVDGPAPTDLARVSPAALEQFVLDGVLAPLRSIIAEVTHSVCQRQVARLHAGRWVVLPLDMFLYFLAAAWGTASFSTYELPCTRKPFTVAESVAWDKQHDMVRVWLLNQWQRRRAHLTKVFGATAWHAFGKWDLPGTEDGGQATEAAEREATAASDSEGDDDIISLSSAHYANVDVLP